ncbi:hypothetical protein L484_004374 [Morus notabilis]|uniref:Uncharacterized protein n=1 Tax=Morus notabilis TaxID=981085 RepID=W9RJ72_9ROSA|nr:hypothetical protein L484_004374 [Morus notabilis]
MALMQKMLLEQGNSPIDQINLSDFTSCSAWMNIINYGTQEILSSEGSLSASFVRPDLPSTTEPSGHSFSTEDDLLLREINEYTANLRVDCDSVDGMVEGDNNDDEDVTTTVRIVDPLGNTCQYTRGMVLGYSESLTGVPLATMSGDPDRLSFTID